MPYTDDPGSTFRNDTEPYIITCTKNSGAFNLTSCKLWMTGKTSLSQNDSQAPIHLSTDDGTIVITDAAGGIAEATVPAGMTANLTQDTVLYVDVQAKNMLTGELKTVYTGRLTVYLDATQALS